MNQSDFEIVSIRFHFILSKIYSINSFLFQFGKHGDLRRPEAGPPFSGETNYCPYFNSISKKKEKNET